MVLDVGYIYHTYWCMAGYLFSHVNSLVFSVSVVHILHYIYVDGGIFRLYGAMALAFQDV